jgi:sodium-coupled neutral amino acid transporter 9
MSNFSEMNNSMENNPLV